MKPPRTPIVFSSRLLALLVAAFCLLAGNHVASAAALARTWTGTDGVWSTPTNWTSTGGSGVPVTGDNVIFNTNPGTLTITSMPATLSLGSGNAFDFAAGAGAFVIGTSATTVTFTAGGVRNLSGNLQTLNFNIEMGATGRTFTATNDITVNGNIGGTGGLTKANAGTLTLNGSNTYSGVSTLNTGTVVAGSDSAFGTSTIRFSGASLTASGGARSFSNTVLLNSGTVTINAGSDVTFNSSGSVTNFGGNRTLSAGNTNTTLAGPVYLSDTSTNRQMTISGAANVTVSGKISNSNGAGATQGQLAYSGSGTLTLSNGSNDHTGLSVTDNGVTIVVSTALRGGTTFIGADSTPSTANATVTSGPVGTAALSFSANTPALAASGGARTIANPIFIGNTATPTISGTNDLTLNGLVTYAGGRTINFTNSGNTTFGGGLKLRDDNLIALRAVTFANAGSGVVTIGSNIIPGSTQNGQVNYSGTGSFVVNGNNSYNGSTTIGAGTSVKIGDANALGSGGSTQGLNFNPNTSITSGGVLDLNGQTGVNELISTNGTGIGSGGSLINSNTSTPASIGNGVANLPITAFGSGYTSLPTISITGGGGSGATAVATGLGLTLANITLTNGGSGYTGNATGAVTGGSGNSASFTGVMSGGVITSITLANPGFGYQPGDVLTVTFTGGGGAGATATIDASIGLGLVGVQITAPGSGYTSAPAVNITDGGGSGAAGNASVTTVTLNAASSIGGAGDTTYDSVVTGANSLTKVGNGKVTLNATNTYTGGTVLNAGILQVENSQALGTTIGATLNGGTLRLGGTNLTLNLPSLTWDQAATLSFDLASDGASDKIVLGAGVFTGTGSSGFTFDFNGTGVDNKTYTLLTFGSSTGFADAGVFSAVNSGAPGYFVLNGTSLQFVTVPEPPQYAAAIMGVLGLVIYFRNRRRRNYDA